MKTQTTSEGVQFGSYGTCDWDLHPTGEFTIRCHECGDDISYGSAYGNNFVEMLEQRCRKHSKKHA